MAAKDCLKNIQYELGLSQVELAEKLDITQASLSSYMRGIRQPSFKTCRKLVVKLEKLGYKIKFKDLHVEK